MPLKNIMFCSKKEAEQKAAWSDWAVISITCPYTHPARLKEGWHSILRLEFDDIDVPEEPCQMFSEQQAREIIAFAQDLQNADRRCTGVLVHCTAGISRSAAIAKWLADRYQLPFPEKYSLYNKLVYQVLREEQMLIGFEGN
jgi:predicted protein tyrosine phosphatase